METPNRRYDHVYAIVRYDASPVFEPTTDITIVRVVWDEHIADREVARLNAVNHDRDCCYFWQKTRLERRPATSTEVWALASSHPDQDPLQ